MTQFENFMREMIMVLAEFCINYLGNQPLDKTQAPMRELIRKFIEESKTFDPHFDDDLLEDFDLFD